MNTGIKKKRGFTLIELIVTVSILAILITILVVAINPVEQLSRSRDARRVAELDALKSALNLYVAQASSTVTLAGLGGDGTTFTSVNSRCKNTSDQTTSSVFLNIGGPSSVTVTNTVFSVIVSSTGQKVASSTAAITTSSTWLPALIFQTPGGSPLSVLPLDPTQGTGTGSASYMYMYVCDVSNGVKNFELNAILESTYFTSDLDVDGLDGGSSASRYEVGTDPGLDLL